MGMFKDKDYDQVIGMTAPLAQHIITVETPNNPRALPAQELAAAVAKVNPSVEAADSIAPGGGKGPGHGRERGRDHHLRLSVLPGRGR